MAENFPHPIPASWYAVAVSDELADKARLTLEMTLDAAAREGLGAGREIT